MRTLAVLLVVTLAGGLCLRTAPAQEPSGSGIIFSQHRQFRIPFSAADGTLKQLQLFASTDQGRTWQPAATAPPEQRNFRFLTDRDGYFWFTVQSTDAQGRLFPATLDGAIPSLKVIVDTQAPSVSLDALPPRGAEVGVTWTVRDENLDLAQPDSLRLEYRPAGGPVWLALSVNPTSNQYYWNPQSTGAISIRLRARDRAGNLGEASTTVGLGGGTGIVQGTPAAVTPAPEAPAHEIPADPDRRFVNSKRITLNYGLKEVGPSGVSAVELWYTLDGRSWNKHPVRFGDEADQKHITFDVASEAVYGITLVAKSGVGLGDRPPQIGDRPQVWLEVDTTRPQVQLHTVIVGTGADKGKLTATWSARDKNLARDPITLSYAERPEGPWKSFAEKLPNNGKHTWQLPEPIPYQFHLRVEAVDRAGNVGEAITDSLVKVDLSNPRVEILKVEPAGR